MAEKMVITRSQAGAETRNFTEPPRSPSATTSGRHRDGEEPSVVRRTEDREQDPATIEAEMTLNHDREEQRPLPPATRLTIRRGVNVGQAGTSLHVEHPVIDRLRAATSVPEHGQSFATRSEIATKEDSKRHRAKAHSVRSHSSTASARARLEYEAEEKLAAIRRQELELEALLVRKKLAADMAALEEESDHAEDEPSEPVDERVNAWLQGNMPETTRGEPSDPLPPKASRITEKQDDTPPRREKPSGGPRGRVEWNTPINQSARERSPTPARSRGRGIEQLAEVLEKMMKRRPPPRQASDLPLFTGAPTEWLQFKAALEETTAIYNFTPLENLARLRNCLRGDAKEAVAPLLSSSTSPQTIMKTLEQCFGRPELIVDRTIEELKRLPRLGGTAMELNAFAVKVQNAVAVLKRVKQGYLYNPLLAREVLEKLSPHQRSRWYDYAEEVMQIGDPEIVRLSEFLMREADRALKHGFGTNSNQRREVSKPAPKPEETRQKKRVFAAATEPNEETDSQRSPIERSVKCPVCKQEHTLWKCPAFIHKDTQGRWDTVKAAGLCFKCIAVRHRRYNCRAKSCGINGCKRPHHRLLHDEPAISTTTAVTNDEETVATTSVIHGREVKLKICPVTVIGPKGEARIYALFDEGSTVTLLDDEVARAIGTDGPARTLNMHGINADRKEANSRVIRMNVRGHDQKEHTLTARTITGMNLLSQSMPESLLKLKHLRDLPQGELCYENRKPQLLIGSDNWQLIVTRELRLGKKNQPAASRTQLGWVLHGNIPKKIISQDHDNVLHIVNIDQHKHNLEELVMKHFDIDALGISTRPKVKEQDQRAIDIFKSTARRIENGQFEVGLPWRRDDVKLPLSYNTAFTRLKSLERKLDKSPIEKRQYEQQVDHLIEKGYAEKCDGSELGSRITWYLPHFSVKNVNKPGKVRMVFDAAAKSRGVCLNDFLLEGPDLLQSLLTILFRFREEAIAVTADIQEMFLQVKIRKEDQPAQMFLWRTDRSEPPTAYKMTSMIFGASSSPFLAHSVRNRNAQDFAESHPEALRAITEAHYMDDFVDSYASREIAKRVIGQVDYVHKQAGFQLRSWTSNDKEVLQGIPAERQSGSATQPITKGDHCEKTLGMLWDSANDVLKFNTSLNRVNEEVRQMTRAPTKREALSTVMSIYDPLGLLSCYTITARIGLQDLWRQKLDWDEPIPRESAEAFTQWLRNLHYISHLELPRSYNGGSPVVNRQLHVFCDASEDAYAAAAYWRLEQEDGEVRVILVAAKAKVAPLKTQTIPRMELQAALIGARLGNYIAKEHRWNTDAIVYWTDAQVVLHWIRNGSRRYTPYVAHRLGEISELSSVHQWRWIMTTLNVADLATRAGYVPKSANDPWFTGPEFLSRPMNEWPQNTPNCVSQEDEQMILHATDSAPESCCLPDVERFSIYERLIRATAMVILFIEKCRDRKRILDVELLKKAEKLWYQKAQRDNFNSEIELLKKGKGVSRSSPLYRLDPIYENGLLHLNGRIGAAHVPPEMKNPIILDGRHPFTRLLVANEHRKAGHANRERVVNDLRQRYWILRLRPTVRTIARDCAFCRLRRANPRTPPTGDLPGERLGAFQRPFSNCGLDYFGPMVVTIGRRHEKRWGALFTCLTTRAVHIELVASLSTDSALMALRRMAARRGWPAVMYSDNATNFKGADAELRRAYEEWAPSLHQLGLQHRMQWKYIPPGAPNQGGAWERLVKSVKTALLVTLNEKSPKEEVLQTLMAEAEYSINARPLTHVSVDRNDPEALTPNHFLIGTSMGLPHTGPCEPADRRTWRVAQALADEFWRRWIREYLPTLVPRRDAGKDPRTLTEGDLVTVVDPLLPRNTWPRGIVERTYPGPDGRVRSADVRTRNGVFRRPTRKLAVLEEAACRGNNAAMEQMDGSPLSPGEAA